MRGILHKSTFLHKLTLPAQILDEERKLTEIFIFTLFCGTSKAFIKLFQAPQRGVKIKI